MAAIGAQYWDRIGAGELLAGSISSGAVTTYAMASLNAGWCARFIARNTNDVYTVYLNWSSVSSPGVVTLRIETIDTASGRPTGTLYDANATLAQAPTSGWQAFTFSTPPSTGLVPGNEYGIMAYTTTGGTTQTLRSHVASTLQGSGYPTNVQTAANATTTDGTSRTGFSEVVISVPICTVVFSDGIELPLEFCPWPTQTAYSIYSTLAAGSKLTVPAGEIWNVRAIKGYIIKNGSPVGDLRARILNSSDALVTGATCTVSRNSLSALSSLRGCIFPFPAPVMLTAGTYRVICDSQSSANSSNCWKIFSGVARVSSLVDSGHIMTNTGDFTAGPPITWTDTNTEEPPLGVLLDSETTSGGGTSILPIRQPARQRLVYVPLPRPFAFRAHAAVTVVRTPPRLLPRPTTIVRNRAAALLPGATTIVNQILPLRAPVRPLARNATIVRNRAAALLPGTTTTVTQIVPINRPSRQSVRIVSLRKPVVLFVAGSKVVIPLRQPPRVVTRPPLVLRRAGNALFASGGSTINQTVLVTSRRVVR